MKGIQIVLLMTLATMAVLGWLAVQCRGPAVDGAEVDVKAFRKVRDKLIPIHTKLGKPQPGDWLAVHKEPGQTFEEYVLSHPVVPDERRRIIYIQPLGDFTAAQRQIVIVTAEFIGLYFDLSVKTLEDLPLSVIPDKARRTHPTWGVKQILTTYVLDEVLGPKLPKDAFAMIAFTAHDLWPGEGWNFVFGQASLRGRVGVWSINRFGDADGEEADYLKALQRAMRTGTHEMGHMFSMFHCTAWECNMCGSNSLPESDRRPLALCPECLAKVCWATGCDPVERFRKLAAFCEKRKLKDESAFYKKSIETLEKE